MAEFFTLVKITVDQTAIMVWKNLQQKRLDGRTTLKEFLIPMAMILFWIYITIQSNTPIIYSDAVYSLRNLPPLSSKGQWGIFHSIDDDTVDVPMYITFTKLLLYSPNNHPEVNELMGNLSLTYPQVEVRGKRTSKDVESEYQANLFTTWAAIQFDLTDEQISSGKLITSTTSASEVNYQLRISPSIMFLPDSTYDSDVYRNAIASADAWINSGYLTIQNFVATYLATQYPGVPNNFTVDTFVQRYPKDPQQDKAPGADYSFSRFMLWKWVASFLLTAALILPILTLASTTVKERENRMKDLLEISGLIDAAYWASYVIAGALISQVMIWIAILLLLAGAVFTLEHISPYAALLTCYSLALIPFLLAFGFVVFRSEYYSLPAFLLSVILCVCGDYLADNENISIGLKLFLGFLAPPMTFTLGIFQTETYLYHHTDSEMNFSHVDLSKHLPNVNSCLGILIASSVFYSFIAWGMPFDWIIPKENIAEILGRMDETVVYPCDDELIEIADEALLTVNDVTHIYPDGTQAVKGISFSVRNGEVLSYLGANGAGKSTTMGMLCGTLPITFGDATVNGYSITRNKVLARRNLGICMQSDVIWEDISIIDHLYLFGRLRGMSGNELKKDVDTMIESLGFPEKAFSAAGTLSGGQKRRLCVGISMVGGNSVVYLDEPTAGLDPVSRRQLWELVQRNRTGRAILLTTHFMDEADVLGDRIAIVKEGRLRAIGSARYLKKKFGMGYLLRCSMDSNSDPRRIQDCITHYVPEASFISNAGTEFAMRLPKEAVVIFPSLFEYIDNNKHSLSVVNYGIETTTLEEVFMRIVNEDTEALITNHQEANQLLGASSAERDKQSEKQKIQDEKRFPLSDAAVSLLLEPGRKVGAGTSNQSILIKQTSVLFWKRFYQFVRSKGQWSMNVVVPCVMIIIAAIIMEAIPDQLTYGDVDTTDISYDTVYTTPIAGSTQLTAETLATLSGVSDTQYVGSNYTALYNFLQTQTVTGNVTSGAAVYYAAPNNATILYNATFPTWYPGLISGVLQNALNDVTGGLLTINTEAKPLPTQALSEQANLAVCFFFVACLIAGSLGAGISIVVSGERVGLVKHQQLASGASLLGYWFANFLWDYLVAVTQTLFFTFALYCAKAESFEQNDFGLILGVGLLFNLCVILRFYVFSNFVGDIRMAQTFYFYGSLLSQFILTTFYSLIVYQVQDGNASSPVSRIIAITCTVADPAFGYLFIVLIQNDFLGIRTQNDGASVTSMSTGGSILLTLFIMVFVYLFALIYFEIGLSQISTFFRQICWSFKTTSSSSIDSALIDRGEEVLSVDDTDQSLDIHIDDQPKIRQVGGQDPDVEYEKSRVMEIITNGKVNTSQNAIFISKINKIFYGRGSQPTKVAVKELSLTIGRGEIFGLLGANGAGKTTLLKIVSGLELPSSGTAMINGFDVVRSRSSAQRSMGLCPQFDTLIERLTVRENLLLFGKIKGLGDDILGPCCEAFMTTLNIKRYENKLIQQLSGGNRRKVSLAVALLGAPPTIYLDEPSTGLDPVASRLMWRLLCKVAQAKKSAVVLTTHNMLECEAVCTRVGVMKLGELVCLGNAQHLRSVHGTGFLLEISVNNPDTLPLCKQFVSEHFSGAVTVDEHSIMVNFEIPKASISRLSVAFNLLENNKDALGIIDYALSQSTLEQVFLKQIRPNDQDVTLLAEQNKTEARIPRSTDYFNAYLCWALAFFIPGLHHFYLGNFWRGMKYLFTINEFFVGWFLDIFELHILVKKSVEEYGSRPCCSCFRCCCCAANK